MLSSAWGAGQERLICPTWYSAGGTFTIYILTDSGSRFGITAEVMYADATTSQSGFNIIDYSSDGTLFPTVDSFLANFSFNVRQGNNLAGLFTMTSATTLPGTGFRTYISLNANSSLFNPYTPFIGQLLSSITPNMAPGNPTAFVPDVFLTRGSVGLPGISLYQDTSTDYILPSPIPNFTIMTVDVVGARVLLPAMNSNPPALAKGQIFFIVNGNFDPTLSFDVCYADGTVIDTIEATGARFFSVQDTSTSNGSVLSYPILFALLSEGRGGFLSGFPLIQPDDLYDNPAGNNHFLNASTVIAIANGGTGQTTRQSALNALVGGVTKSAILYGNGTDIILLPTGSSGQFLSIDSNGNLVWINDPNVVTEFSWIPVDVNGNPLTVAVGRGRVDGKAVILDFYIQYSSVSGGGYAQINGWDPSLNPGDITGVGSASTITAIASPNGYPNQITLLVDRLALRCNGVVNVMADVANQYITGHIEYYLDTSSIAIFEQALKSGKILPYDAKAYNKGAKEFTEKSKQCSLAKREEFKSLLDSVSVQSFSEVSKSGSLLTRREYNDLKRRVSDLGTDEVRAEMFPETA